MRCIKWQKQPQLEGSEHLVTLQAFGVIMVVHTHQFAVSSGCAALSWLCLVVASGHTAGAPFSQAAMRLGENSKGNMKWRGMG